jgi:hypothetical protein
MRTVLPYLIGLTMAATLGVLFAGIVTFAFGNSASRGLATRLMIARVAIQGVAIALFGLLVFLSIE